MQDLVKEKLDRLIEIFQEVSSGYKWEGSLTNHFTALTYTLNNRVFDKEKVEDVRKHMKKTTGIFSNYRGTPKILLSALLTSKYDNPNQEFDRMLNYDKRMRDTGFKNNMYLPIANYALLASCSEEWVEIRINKALEIYKEMKKNHPWLTKETHLYTAAALVSDVFIENMKGRKDLIQTTIGISIEALIAAQTVAIIAAASSTAAAAGASASS